MKLESQVCSLELAQKLKELGVEQDSLFCWGEVNFSRSWADYEWELHHKDLFPKNWHNKNLVSAYTVAELGEMLPASLECKPKPHKTGKKEIFELSSEKEWTEGEVNYKVTYTYFYYEPMDYFQLESPTEADARAKMLIYLLENKLITV